MQKKCIILFIFILTFSHSSLLMANLNIQAQGAVLLEPKTNTILYAKNANKKFYPASMTKILTALIVSERLPEDTIITKSKSSINTVPNDSSSIGLQVGDTYTKYNALYGLLLGSDNYIAHDLALATSGSINAFADLMNQKAKAFGALNTHFTNPHGYHDPNHYTTPYDMSQIAKVAFENSSIQKISGTTSYNFHIRNKNKFLPIKNTSRLLKSETAYYNPYVVASKTGFHDDAGQTLVAKAVYDDIELIAVVMNEQTPNQYIDINTLLEYGKTYFATEEVGSNYVLKNKTLSLWAEDSINESIQKGWTDSFCNYKASAKLSDIVKILEKEGTLKPSITSHDLTNLIDAEANTSLTRLQFAKIIHFVTTKWQLNLPALASNITLSDIGELPASDKNAIFYVTSRKLMSPLEERFNPNRIITVEEVLTTFDRLFSF